MSQAWADFIWGVPLTDELVEVAIQMCEDEGMVLPDLGSDRQKRDFAVRTLVEYGFSKGYSGNGETPCYLGEIVGGLCEGGPSLISDIPQFPTGEQKTAFQVKYDALPPQLQEHCGEPSMWVVWSTS